MIQNTTWQFQIPSSEFQNPNCQFHNPTLTIKIYVNHKRFFPKQLGCWGSIGLSRLDPVTRWFCRGLLCLPLCLPVCLPLCPPLRCEMLSPHGSGFVSHFVSHFVFHCSVRFCHNMDLALSPTLCPAALWDLVTTWISLCLPCCPSSHFVSQFVLHCVSHRTPVGSRGFGDSTLAPYTCHFSLFCTTQLQGMEMYRSAKWYCGYLCAFVCVCVRVRWCTVFVSEKSNRQRL